MSAATLTTIRTGTLPRVNLLPPEIAEEARFRRLRAGLALAVVVALAAVGSLFFLAASDAAKAQDDLAVAEAQKVVLEGRAAEYAAVPATYEALDAARTQLTAAMGQEIRWSYYLNDLSLSMPRDSWLTSLSAAGPGEAAAAAAPAAGAAGAAGAPAALPTGLGQITFTGKGYAHNDLATFLQMLAKQKGFASPYFTASTEGEIGTTDIVEFDSTVVLTEDALSGRYAAGTSAMSEVTR